MSALRSYGITARAVTPYTDHCPLCDYNTLVIQNDYVGGYWFRCLNHSCGFTGGPIELVMRKEGLKLHGAVDRLVRLSERWNLRSVLVPTEINKYALYQRYQTRVLEFWTACRTMPLSRIQNDPVQFMRRLGVWSGYVEVDWRTKTAAICGISCRKEVGAYLPGGTRVATRRAGEPVLVIRFDDLPGRIHAFEFHTEDARIFNRVLENGSTSEAGLAFLEFLRTSEEVVFALGHTMTALHLQHRHLYATNTVLPLVAWRHDTCRAWTYVRGREVVFWEPQLSWTIFRHAMQVPNARVARREGIPDSRLLTYPMVFLHALREVSRPWPEMLKTELLRLDHAETVEWVANLQLSAADWSRVLDTCSHREREKLRQFVGEAGFERYVSLGGTRVVERAGKWYAQTAAGAEQLLTDAPFHISSVIYREPTERTYVVGTISYEEHAISFQVDEQLLRRNPTEFIRRLVVRSGAGYPVFNRKGQSFDWVDLAIQFSNNPPVIVDSGRVGWDAKNNHWVFPNLTLTADGIRAGSTTMSSPETIPAFHLLHSELAPKSLRLWSDSDHPALATYWATFSAVMYNLTAPLVGNVPVALGLVGVRSSVAGVVLDTLVKQFGMLGYALGRSRSSATDLIAVQGVHDIPIHVRIADDYMEAMTLWLENEGTKNCILLVSQRMAFGLGIRPGWIFIRGDNGEPRALPSMEGLITNFLLHFMTKLVEFQDTKKTVHDYLKFLGAWIRGASDHYTWTRRVDTLLERAKKLLSPVSPVGSIPPDRRLMALIFRLIDDQKLVVVKVGERARRAAITIDEDRKLAIISFREVVRALKKMGIPPPASTGEWADLLEAQQVVVHDAEPYQGIPVQLAYWDEQLARWKSTYRCRALIPSGG